MKIFGISDLHLSINNPKPMDIFGEAWANYWETIIEDWVSKVSEQDIVLISGDISWAMNISNAIPDLQAIATLPGRKVIIRGNHDYWWSSYSKVKSALPSSIYAIQNNAIEIDGVVIAGTRGWTLINNNSSDQDKKIYARELMRLRMSLDEAVKISNDTKPIYLMIHYPPFNALWQDSDFTNIIKEYPVQSVIYGHLHGNDCRVKNIITKDNIPYIITSCDIVKNELQLIQEI